MRNCRTCLPLCPGLGGFGLNTLNPAGQVDTSTQHSTTEHTRQPPCSPKTPWGQAGMAPVTAAHTWWHRCALARGGPSPVSAHLQTGTSLPLQTGRRRRRVALRKGRALTPEQESWPLRQICCTHSGGFRNLGLGCFLSSARIRMRVGLDSSLPKDLLGRAFPDRIPSIEKSSSRRRFWERPSNNASRVTFLCWWMNHFPVPQGKSPSLMH